MYERSRLVSECKLLALEPDIVTYRTPLRHGYRRRNLLIGIYLRFWIPLRALLKVATGFLLAAVMRTHSTITVIDAGIIWSVNVSRLR